MLASSSSGILAFRFLVMCCTFCSHESCGCDSDRVRARFHRCADRQKISSHSSRSQELIDIFAASCSCRGRWDPSLALAQPCHVRRYRFRWYGCPHWLFVCRPTDVTRQPPQFRNRRFARKQMTPKQIMGREMRPSRRAISGGSVYMFVFLEETISMVLRPWAIL